jgi:hypothetical protein
VPEGAACFDSLANHARGRERDSEQQVREAVAGEIAAEVVQAAALAGDRAGRVLLVARDRGAAFHGVVAAVRILNWSTRLVCTGLCR